MAIPLPSVFTLKRPLYLQQAVIMEHVSTQEQVEGSVEEREVTGSTLFLGIHHSIFVPHFLNISSDSFGALRGLLHLLLQLFDVVVVLLQGAADGLLRNHKKHLGEYAFKLFVLLSWLHG